MPEANALAPLLEEHLERIDTLYAEARLLHDTLEAPARTSELPEAALAVADAERAHDGIQRLEAQIRDEVLALTRLGASVTGLSPPAVDLPARLGGRPVRLSYALGDQLFTHWHGTDAADARWPIDDESAFGLELPQ